MTIRLLGPLELVDDGGTAIDIGGTQPRLILALLVAAEGRLIAADALIDAIWDEAPPPSAAGTLQTYVSRLRRSLAAVGGSIVHESAGYRLEIDRDRIDVRRFDELTERARAALDSGDAARARAMLIDAERLWRGPALLDVRDRARITGIARRLDDRRLAAVEDRIGADLALGRHSTAASELTQLVAEHPWRERLWELLALARYRAGMQADALRAIGEARDTLVGTLGIDPGPALRRLEHAILTHDPSLDYVPADRDDPSAPAHSLIGRDDELAALLHALDEVSAGRPRIAVVEGEAGVGKTRLVEEAATEAARRGCVVVWGRSLEGAATPAYWPWLSVLRILRASDPGSGNAAIDRFLDATGSTSAAPGAGDRPQLLEGVLGTLGRVPHAEQVRRLPLVVVFEDVQWADVESLELTTQLASALVDEPVLLVLTMREGDDEREDNTRADAVVALLAAVSRRPGTLRLRLDGLDATATAAVLAQVAGGAVDDELARVVHQRAEGNPFYAIELQRLLDTHGVVDAASIARLPVPAGIRDVVRRRLARLPQATLDLLHLAAVAGRDLDVELIGVASGRPIDRCLDDLEVALDHRLLTDGGPRGGLRFSHALVREVVADELSSLRRARAHLALADAIVATGRGDEQAEIVAEHLWAAVPIGAGRRAADALDRAADVAIARFAVTAAGDLLTRSLDLRRSLGADADDELDTLVKLTWALRARGGYQGGLAHYARGVELANRLGRRDVAVEMQWAEWAGYDTACDFARARPVATRLREWAASSDDPTVQLAGYAAWAIQSWHDGDLGESAATFRLVADVRSSMAATIAPTVGAVSLVDELSVLSTAFGLYLDEQVGRLPDPYGSFAATAATLHGNFPVAIVWSFACTSATSAGDLERVECCSRNVLAAEAGETLGFWGSQARMYLGAAMIATGRAGDGRTLFDAGFRGYAAAGMHTGLALMLAAAASAEVIAGDLDRAAAHLAAAHEELERGERWPVPYVRLAAADLAEASGAPAADVHAGRIEAEGIARAQGAVVAAERARAAANGERWLGASMITL